MSLVFSSIKDAGDRENERLVFTAPTGEDVGAYVVLRTRVNTDVPTTGVKNAFWFPDYAVGAGDLVVLYTKPGARSTKEIADGKRAHFFYWALPEPIFGSASAAVLLHVDSFDYQLSGITAAPDHPALEAPRAAAT